MVQRVPAGGSASGALRPRGAPTVFRALDPRRRGTEPFQRWFSAVAAIIILAVSIPLYQNWKMNTAPLDDESIEQYLSYHPTIYTEDIISHLDESDLISLQKQQSLETETIEKYLLENETFEQYLID